MSALPASEWRTIFTFRAWLSLGSLMLAPGPPLLGTGLARGELRVARTACLFYELRFPSLNTSRDCYSGCGEFRPTGGRLLACLTLNEVVCRFRPKLPTRNALAMAFHHGMLTPSETQLRAHRTLIESYSIAPVRNYSNRFSSSPNILYEQSNPLGCSCTPR